MLVEQPPQIGGLRIAWTVERPGSTQAVAMARSRYSGHANTYWHENTCTLGVEPTPASLDITDNRQAGYVADASVGLRRSAWKTCR